MLLVGVLAGLGDGLLLYAFSIAQASRLAPFQYTQLVWALLFGFLVFGETPDVFSISGALLIMIAGVHLLRSEH